MGKIGGRDVSWRCQQFQAVGRDNAVAIPAFEYQSGESQTRL